MTKQPVVRIGRTTHALIIRARQPQLGSLRCLATCSHQVSCQVTARSAPWTCTWAGARRAPPCGGNCRPKQSLCGGAALCRKHASQAAREYPLLLMVDLGGPGADVPPLLDWGFGQVFGERLPGDEVQGASAESAPPLGQLGGRCACLRLQEPLLLPLRVRGWEAAAVPRPVGPLGARQTCRLRDRSGRMAGCSPPAAALLGCRLRASPLGRRGLKPASAHARGAIYTPPSHALCASRG